MTPSISAISVEYGRLTLNCHDVDLHGHSRTSSCGYSTHQRLLDLARAGGRGVLAVTDHESAAGGVAVRDLARRTGDDVLVLARCGRATPPQRAGPPTQPSAELAMRDFIRKALMKGLIHEMSVADALAQGQKTAQLVLGGELRQSGR